MPIPPFNGGLGVADATAGGNPPSAGEKRPPTARVGRRRALTAPGRTRGRTVKPRFSAEELVLIRAISAQCGWSVRGWLGQVALAAGGARMPVPPPAFHRPQVRVVRECWWQVRRVEVLTCAAAGWTGDAPSVRALVARCAAAGAWGQMLVDRLIDGDRALVRIAGFHAAYTGQRGGRRPRGSEPRIRLDVDFSDAEWTEVSASAEGADLSLPEWITAVGVATAGLAARAANGPTGALIDASQRVRRAGQALNATVAQMHREDEVPPRIWKEIEMADEQVSHVTEELERLLAQREVGQDREPLIDMTQPPARSTGPHDQ